VRDTVTRALARYDFAVEAADDPDSAMSAVRRGRADIVLIDMTVPGGGLELLHRLRHLSDVPVILMGRDREELDRVVGLEMGADDAVDASIPETELVARVRAHLRRTRQKVTPATLVFGPLSIDLLAREVLLEGDVVDLTRREFDLLAFLASSPLQVFTRAQLLAQVWESSEAWQNPETVTEHVRRLRQKLEPDPSNPRWIVTVRGVGYRFEWRRAGGADDA
jgi:DNA-binding response OmpR family regulator